MHAFDKAVFLETPWELMYCVFEFALDSPRQFRNLLQGFGTESKPIIDRHLPLSMASRTSGNRWIMTAISNSCFPDLLSCFSSDSWERYFFIEWNHAWFHVTCSSLKNPNLALLEKTLIRRFTANFLLPSSHNLLPSTPIPPSSRACEATNMLVWYYCFACSPWEISR